MIVIVEPGFEEPHCLLWCQHAERGAGLHSQILDRAHHITNLVEIAVFWMRGRHAEARRTRVLRALRGGHHVVAIHETGGLSAGLIMRALRTVAAVFRTPVFMLRRLAVLT